MKKFLPVISFITISSACFANYYGHPQSGYSTEGYYQSGYPQSGYYQQSDYQSGYPQSGYYNQGYYQQGYSQPAYHQQYYQPGYDGSGYYNQGYSQSGQYQQYDQPSFSVSGYDNQGHSQPVQYQQSYSQPDQSGNHQEKNNNQMRPNDNQMRSNDWNMTSDNANPKPKTSPSYAESKEAQKYPQDRYQTDADRQLNARIRGKITGWLSDEYKNVSLNTANGVVTVNGSVDSEEANRKLTEEVRKIDGVKSVNNMARVVKKQ